MEGVYFWKLVTLLLIAKKTYIDTLSSTVKSKITCAG